MEGTTLSYVSPAFFQMLRDVTESVISQQKAGGAETLIMKTMWDLMIPADAQGEGSVTTSSMDGILVVSNSAHSYKSRLVNPMFMGGLQALLSTPIKRSHKASALETVERFHPDTLEEGPSEVDDEE